MSSTEVLSYKGKCIDLIEYINDVKKRKKEMKEAKRKEKNSVQGINREIDIINKKITKIIEHITTETEQIKKLKVLKEELVRSALKKCDEAK